MTMPASLEPTSIAPHSQDAEEAVLGSILINPDAYHEVAPFLRSEDFFILRNAWVWEAMTRLIDRNEIVEYLTVINELRSQTRLDHVGGAAYITFLASNVATSIYAEAYGRIVERASIRRRLLTAAVEVAQLARNEDMNIREIVTRSEAIMLAATEMRGGENLEIPDDALEELIGEIEAMRDGEAEPNVVKTYTSLDHYLTGGGLEAGGYIISSDTSGGKSLLMINWMLNQARNRVKAGMFTMEMKKKSVLRRMLARMCGISTDHLALGKIPDEKDQVYKDAIIKLSFAKEYLLIDESKLISIFEIIGKIRRAIRKDGLQIVYVDYTGLIDDDGMDEDQRHKIVGKFVRLLQSLASQTGIPIVMGAQQNRQGGGIKGVGESYEIAQHCDGFFFIEDAEDQTDKKAVIRKKKITIEKQRDGKRGVDINMMFNLATQDAYEVPGGQR